MQISHLDYKQKAVIIALIILGFAGLIDGIYTMEVGDLNYNAAIMAPSLYPIPINDSRVEFVTAYDISTVYGFFNTTDTFSAGRPFDITIKALSGNLSEYDKVVTLPLDARINMTILKDKAQLQRIVDDANVTRNLIILFPDNGTNSFHGGFKHMVVSSEGDLIFMIVPYKSGKIVHEFPLFPNHPLKIYPSTAQYQVDTNRNIQKQNIESAKSSSHVEGLTYVIIGLVFIGSFIEIILRKYVLNNN